METCDKRLRVLVIEDDPVTIQFIHHHLGDHDVVGAPSGEEGVARVQAGQIELVLLDVVLPGIDGFEVLGRLRADLATRELPVIVLTFLEDREHAVKAFELGADDYLQKPVEPWELRARVRAHGQRHRLAQQIQKARVHQALREITLSLSHVMNNPLFVIQGFAELIERGRAVATAECARRIQKAGERIADTVRALVEFAREPESCDSPVDLNQVLQTAARLAKGPLAMTNVQLEYDLARDPLWVQGKPTVMTAEVVDLLLNTGAAASPGTVMRVKAGLEDGIIVASVEAGNDRPEVLAQRLVSRQPTRAPGLRDRCSGAPD
ncbi:MAG: hybrid sensor histidine kinase/response regulator [Candidatus Riflebacteria bacterium]|nr:hybrid sensor histidine kinase/response regulator [Candidatus Riflebacteria bacterium]